MMPTSPGDTNMMGAEAYRSLWRLRRAIAKAVPTVGHIYIHQGRWFATRRDAHWSEQGRPVSELLNEARLARLAIPAWRRNLTDKTAAEVEAMCHRLLAGNPNNRFVREQYPDLFEAITAEQQMATTHRSTHGTDA